MAEYNRVKTVLNVYDPEPRFISEYGLSLTNTPSIETLKRAAVGDIQNIGGSDALDADLFLIYYVKEDPTQQQSTLFRWRNRTWID